MFGKLRHYKKHCDVWCVQLLYVSSCKHNIYSHALFAYHKTNITANKFFFPFWSSVIWKSNIITKNIIRVWKWNIHKTYKKHQENEILCSSIKKKEKTQIHKCSPFSYPYFCYVFCFCFCFKTNWIKT